MKRMKMESPRIHLVINAVTDIPLREIISEIWAFLAVLIVALLAMLLMPDLVLWLPRVFGYQG